MRRAGMAVLILIWAAPVFSAVPISGREQHMVFAREPVQAVAAAAYREELSHQAANGMLDRDQAALKRIRRLSSRLIAQAIQLKPEASNWAWEVHISSDPQVAAYSMGGGKLLIGIHFIDSYKLTDNELAVALAHEIGHVIAEHVREQISLAASFNKSVPLRTRKVTDVVNAMESDISVFLRLQPLSRLQEIEADDIGIELAARAGIPPSAAISFYSKLAQTDNRQSIFDTHGPSVQRVKFADSMAGYAWPIYEASRNAKFSPSYAFVTTTR